METTRPYVFLMGKVNFLDGQKFEEKNSSYYSLRAVIRNPPSYQDILDW